MISAPTGRILFYTCLCISTGDS